ncbi:DUF4197 domain-containing protein [uncultured Hymenobacter sp.]|uniref:DUF4197 domain-containing protein n=1 Tax=uncultured Hymenobacter sp. TaxID=170016 RepID=UPI0035CB3AB6
MRRLFASPAPLLALGLLLASSLSSLAQTRTKTTTTTTRKTAVKKPVAKKPAAKKLAAKPAVVAAPAPVAPAPAPTPLTPTEANQGIKEALTQGVTRAVQFASEPDGFNLNDDIRIPFPPDAQIVALTIGRLPLGQSALDNVTNLLNRAAEAAAPQAKDIFLNAVQSLTINDALTLVTSRQSDAATQVLRRTTETQLQAACKPIIEQQLSQVGATKAYANLINRYNKIPLMTPASTDLTDYVTKETVDGLFVLLAQQEAKIRKNPAAQASAVLQRVFGAAK